MGDTVGARRNGIRGLTFSGVVLLAVLGYLALHVGRAESLAAAPPRSTSCPHRVPLGPPPHNSWRAAERKLAPTAVVKIVLCRYTYRFIRRVVVPAASAQPLVRDFDALRRPTYKENQVFTSCPLNLAPIVAHLAYANGHSVAIYVPTNHCISASNGDIRRAWPAVVRLRLRDELLRLTAR